MSIKSLTASLKISEKSWFSNFSFKDGKQECSAVAIYNYITAENNLTWSEMGKKVALGVQPLEKKIWNFSHVLVRSALVFVILNFLFHTIPTLVLDLFAGLTGKKRIYSKTMKKFELLINSLSPFNSHQWTFGNKNYSRLVKETEDFKFQREEHSFDYCTINWDEFFKNFIPGINRYFLKTATPEKHGSKDFWVQIFFKNKKLDTLASDSPEVDFIYWCCFWVCRQEEWKTSFPAIACARLVDF